MVIFHGELLNNQRVLFFDCLVVSTPLKNINQLGCLFPIYGKIIHMFQTTNQLMLISSIQNRAKIQRALQHLRSLHGSQLPASRTRRMTGFWLILRVPIDARMVPIVLSTIIYRIHCNHFNEIINHYNHYAITMQSRYDHYNHDVITIRYFLPCGKLTKLTKLWKITISMGKSFINGHFQ